jgi:signal transduction histidine kinase
LHIDSSKIVDTFLSDHILRSDSEKLSELLRAIKLKSDYQNIFDFNTLTKEPLAIKLTFTPILNHKDNVQELIAIGFDVTLIQSREQIVEEKATIQAQQKWEDSKLFIQQSKMASMGEMIGNIAHQWRQPLNSLGLMFQKLNIAYHNDKLNKDIMEQSMQKSMRIIDQMSKTIDDFRNFFRVDKEQQYFTINSTIDSVTSIIGMSLHEYGITLKINSSKEIEVIGFKNELAQVILNIISNAKDAIVENSVEAAQINIDLSDDENSATIIIDDNAGGIDEKIIDKIFEPYFSTKDDDHGTGVGLYMSKVIIEDNMRGKLEVFNTLSGASFKIVIPKNMG